MRLRTVLLTALTGALSFATPAAGQNPPEVVIVPFRGGPTAASTTGSYAAEVWLCVTGGGRAAGQQLSDAFFVYRLASGESLPPPGVLGTNEEHPWHSSLPFNWVLRINALPAEDFIVPSIPTIPSSTVPQYNPVHVYAFPIAAPGGPLTFGVGDSLTVDNGGAYQVAVGTRTQMLRLYLDEVLRWMTNFYIWDAITVPDNDLHAQLQSAARHVGQGETDTARAELDELLRSIRLQSGVGVPTANAHILTVAIEHFLTLLQS